MRSRGCYRLTDGTNGHSFKTKQIVEDLDNEVIDISEDHISTKRSKYESNKDNVITIDSDIDIEEEDEIQMIESGNDSFKCVSVVEEMPIRKPSVKLKPPIKKCDICFRRLTDGKDYEYNHLTSADFYDNPRIHPSVISIELKDRNRFNCFEESIGRNRDLFADKTVLIIGSGTGLLALFAARARAKNVIIVDRIGILEIIESVIERNQRTLPKTKFFFLRQSVEESDLPNGLKKVDIIVSDWANHSLFYKSMALTFIKARDKWLRKGGRIFPDSAHLYLAGGHDFIHKHTAKDLRNSDSLYVKRIDYWSKNVYGFDMTAVRHKVLTEPFHENVSKSQVITNEFLIKAFDLLELTEKDINFCIPFELNAIKNHYLQTFVVFFDVIFSKCQTVPLMYSTRPTAYKHMFRPTVLFIDSQKQLTIYKDDKIIGKFKYELTKDLKDMSIDINFEFKNRFLETKEELFYSTN